MHLVYSVRGAESSTDVYFLDEEGIYVVSYVSKYVDRKAQN